MKCPKCGFARPLSDQVCRRCKYIFDEDRFLSLAPPRAAGGSAPSKFHAGRSWTFMEELRSRPWIPPMASLLPGMGHVIQGKPWLGVLYLALVALFGWMSVTFFSQTYGQMIFGLAVSTHATCILDTTPWGRSPEAKPRILAMAAILTGLLFMYWPLVVRLAARFVESERRNVDQSWGPMPLLGIGQILIMLILFGVSIVFSTWISRKLSSRES
jgi:hypothetical protein